MICVGLACGGSDGTIDGGGCGRVGEGGGIVAFKVDIVGIGVVFTFVVGFNVVVWAVDRPAMLI